jgi:hypothetical protein
MSDAKDSRPWWRKRSNQGIVLTTIGGVLALTPGAPVIFTAFGVWPVTSAMIAAAISAFGAAWGTSGAARRADSAKQETQPDVPTPFKVVGKGGVK